MQAISPVLAGTFDTPDYRATSVNFNPAAATTSTNPASATDATTAVAATPAVDTTNSTSSNYIDPRRYSKFDRSASQVADAPDFSFGDFLDMVNPLQHIPVVSSVYRAATGSTINPVARVAGDIMYGGAVGAISAVIGGTSAIADVVSETQTGHDKTGAVLAALFGDDKDKTTQLASADKTAPTAAAAATPNINNETQMAASATMPAVTPAPLAAADVTSTATFPVTTAPTAVADASSPFGQTRAFPLNKAAYGGVMAPPNDIESQNRIIALSQGSHAMRLGHTIYTSPLMNGAHPLPVAAPATTSDTAIAAAATTSATTAGKAQASIDTDAATTPAGVTANAQNTAATAYSTATTSSATVAAGHNPLPQNLVDDMIMMKALSQYQNTAAGPAALGANLDMKN